MAIKNNDTKETTTIPAGWKQLVDSETIARSIKRISYEIVEKDRKIDRLAIIGIRTGGEIIAQRIKEQIEQIEGKEIPFGVLDITLYRDDLSHATEQPLIKGTELPFRVSGHRIILVDDVLYTGRTVRAALDAIIDFGRPDQVELAVLVDRGHRELPIRPDYVGKNLPTHSREKIRVCLKEMGYEDGIYLIESKKR